jgi:Trk K+ transport system NAD-binding subunit
VDVKIAADSPNVGRSLRDINFPKDSKLALIIPHEGTAQVPSSATILQAEDQIIAVTGEDSVEALKDTLRG